MIYLEYQDDVSAKFWQIDVVGNSHTVTYGKIGTQGTSKTKTFDDETACQKDADKLIKAKKAKGYAEQGQTPIKKPQTPAQKNQQAMMDELDLLIKDGNTAKTFEFLQKYKDGNITTLKKALPKLRRHWLDWREIPMPTGKTYYGRLGGDAQQQVLGVLALGLLSPSDYNNQWSWLSWQINWGWFNDDIIDGLTKVGCTVLSHIVKENKEVSFGYDMLRKLEKAGLVEYDAVAFVSGFLRLAHRHVIRHNEHLTKAYKRSKRQNKPAEQISKFANQYEYEGKTAPEPKRITIITEEEPKLQEPPQGELYQGELVPFITLNLSAFDDDPVVIRREFHDLFEFETPVNGTRYTYYYANDEYCNVQDFANPYHQWIAHYVERGEMDRMWVLTKCLEIQTNLWSDANKAFFRGLFDCLAPTNDEKIALQDSLFALLTHETKAVINFALGHIKTVYQDERFGLAEYLGYWQALFMNSDNKTAIKTLISQATALLKDKSFGQRDDVLTAICGAFLVGDVSIQEKVAKLIGKYAKPNDELNAVLAMYLPVMNADSRALLADFVEQDEMAVDIQNYEYEPQGFEMGETLTGFEDFTEWLFALSTATQGNDPKLFEPILAGYLSLLYTNALPDDAHEQLKAVLKRFNDRYIENYSTDIFVRSWCCYVFDDTMLASKALSHWHDNSLYSIYRVWHNLLRHFYHLTKLYHEKGLILPMLSTPTHTSSVIDFDVFMDRLLAYQVAGVGVDVSDLAVAMARTAGVEPDKCQTRLDTLQNPYIKEILLCHFGLTEVPETVPPSSWQDKNGDDFIQKLSTYLKEKTSDNKHQNQFDMTKITSNNWQAWRGLWAVAVLTHRDVYLVHDHHDGRIYDKVIKEPKPMAYHFHEIRDYDYTTGKHIPTGTYRISIELPLYHRHSATSDLYRRQYYKQTNRYWNAMYDAVSEKSVTDMIFVRSLTPYRTEYADAVITDSVMDSYSNNVLAHERILAYVADKSMLNRYDHILLADFLFNEKKQTRQMATDTLSMLISRGVIDVAMLSEHILTVITKSDLPFMRFCESIERLASYGGASAHVVQMLIAHILANIQLEKLPTGFKKCVEIYYTQLAERGQAPSDDVKNALAGLVEKSSGLKTIVNKINKL